MAQPPSRIGELLVREKMLSLTQLQQAQDEAKFLTQYNIDPVVASEASVEAALSRYYDKGPDLDQMMGDIGDLDNVDYAAVSDDNVNIVDLENQAGEAPVVKLCNAILLSA